MASESEIQNRILLELGREPDVTLWRQNTGQAKAETVTRAHLERLFGWLTTARNENQFKAQAANAAELIRALLKEPTRYTRYGLTNGSSDIIGIVQRVTRKARGCMACAGTGRSNGFRKPDPCVHCDGKGGNPAEHTGIFLALEVKPPGGNGVRPGVVKPEQQMFLDIVNRRGGVGRVVRSVEDARAAINEARNL